MTAPTVRLIKLLIDTFSSAIDAKDDELTFGGLKEKPKKIGDQYVVPVFPYVSWDSLAYPGITGEVWIQPGQEVSQGSSFKEKLTTKVGNVALVLGAGNQTSIPIMDSLYFLINCSEVVYLKHNPINQWLYPIVDKLMAPFIEKGVFAHGKGGAEEGKYLLKLVDNVHITGSDRTHDMIVWEEKDKNDPEVVPSFTKKISSELGCVTPNIIVPGKYSNSQLKYLAENIAGATGSNCSFNCLAPKLLVTQRDWPQREAFLSKLRKAFNITPSQYPYYPGANIRHTAFKEHYPQAETIGKNLPEDYLPFLLIPHVEPTPGQKAFTTEAWAPVLCETGLDVSENEFLDQAVDFVNNHVWGNLSCTVYILPSTEKSQNEALNRAIKNLRYGTVSINVWSAVAYTMCSPWGAYPGNTLKDIQSGVGYVHNPYMLDNVQKSVYRAPLQLLFNTKLPWFSGSKNSEKFYNMIADFEFEVGALSTSSLLWNAAWN